MRPVIDNVKIISEGKIKGTLTIGDKEYECEFNALLMRKKETLPSPEELLKGVKHGNT